MPKAKVSGSVNQEIDSNSNSDTQEVGAPANRNRRAEKNISDYERQRMRRIEENRARMEALGLKKMANSFVGSLPKQTRKMSDRKGKRKVDDDDEEYRPSEGEEGWDSSSEEDGKDGEFYGSRTKNKAKNKIQTPKKQISSIKPVSEADFIDDNEALLQAIALSLQDSSGFTDVNTLASQNSMAQSRNSMRNEREGNSHIQEDTGKRKRKKSINNRVQMTEDELIVHFFQFDEAGKGGISLRDLRRMAAAHDFMWSDKEMEDMIQYFSSDRDGKVSLDDFRKIASRCNLLQGLETAMMRKP